VQTCPYLFLPHQSLPMSQLFLNSHRHGEGI
jgi:hypothetical protein